MNGLLLIFFLALGLLVISSLMYFTVGYKASLIIMFVIGFIGFFAIHYNYDKEIKTNEE